MGLTFLLNITVKMRLLKSTTSSVIFIYLLSSKTIPKCHLSILDYDFYFTPFILVNGIKVTKIFMNY